MYVFGDMEEWKAIDGLNVDICNRRSGYYIEFMDQYLEYCSDNDIIIIEEIKRSIEYFYSLKAIFNDTGNIKNKDITPFAMCDHLKVISVTIDMFKNEGFGKNLETHIKIMDRKRKINNILN